MATLSLARYQSFGARPMYDGLPARAVIAIALALLAASCGSTDTAKSDAESLAPVSVIRVAQSSPQGAISATGTVRLRRETPLAFLSDGRVGAVSVREGDVVRAGQALARLDTTAIDATAASATAESRRSDSELARQRQLFRQGWVAKSRVENAEAVASAASAGLSAARFNQRFSLIAAPTSGIVLARLAEPGQTLAAGTPVVVLGEFASGFVIRVPMTGADVAGLRLGQTATVTFSGGAAPSMAATVVEIAGRADARTGTFQVEFALPASPALRSGLIGRVSVPLAGGEGTMRIPATALFSARADEGFVWRIDAPTGKITARMVALGGITDDGVEILAGLAPGDSIIQSGVDQLVEGQRVKPVASQPGKAVLR